MDIRKEEPRDYDSIYAVVKALLTAQNTQMAMNRIW